MAADTLLPDMPDLTINMSKSPLEKMIPTSSSTTNFSASSETQLRMRNQTIENGCAPEVTDKLVSEVLASGALSHCRPVHVQKEASLLSRGSLSRLASRRGSREQLQTKRSYVSLVEVKNRSTTSLTTDGGISSGDPRSATSTNPQELQHQHTPFPKSGFTGFKHLFMMVLFVGNARLFTLDAHQFGFWDALSNAGLNSHDIIAGIILFTINMLYMPLALLIERAAASSASKRKLKLSASSTTKTQTANTLSASPPSRSPSSISLAGAESGAGAGAETFEAKSHQLLNAASEGFAIFSALHIVAAFVSLYYGTSYVYYKIKHPLIGTLCEANTIVTFMKLSSFGLTNNELRTASILGLPTASIYKSCEYPKNLTLSNIAYFWSAPTLVYQPVYPRTAKIRWFAVLSLLAEVGTIGSCIWFLAMQMASPILQHVVVDYQQGEWGRLFDDYLSLVTVNICIWLLGFFALFQSGLNCIAEVSRFADRDFYQDWWNAGCVGTFWRDWNKPVSNAFRRHVYTPLRKRGWSGFTAANVVFVMSAVLHELLFGASTHNFNGVAFFCMMAQTPLILVTAPLEKMRGKGTVIGNCVFWISILFGMPTAIVIYYLAWHLRQFA